MSQHPLRRLSTPRAAAAAGVLFALLFGAALILIRAALPEGAEPGSQWLVAGSTNLKIAATLMPFAGISFLWFMGVVRDGLGGYEDRFFATVFIGSGLLFLAMMFLSTGVGAGLERSGAALDSSAATLGQMVLLTISKTYALRMAAVFMMSLATIWLKTGLMPRWLVVLSYLVAVVLLIGSDITMWLTLVFPLWVLVVSLLLLVRAGVIDLPGEHHPPASTPRPDTA
ncbi:preprotein translocase subunit Sec61beta [Mycobacterium frederiksbergense]|uniref:Preprotein translocase subunit Sec61beta n=1 Tax=Mycolicibacterium frederiksbergense TaxID=117567 RepID=A0ABT6L836_9MYCO|nr:hypothetical protein [Mycolicibacterium frederiksbergense]MDH6198140.1 preprotein translocase subunit Sec61beta [Mycolicibacterium frederiksbergense]